MSGYGPIGRRVWVRDVLDRGREGFYAATDSEPVNGHIRVVSHAYSGLVEIQRVALAGSAHFLRGDEVEVDWRRHGQGVFRAKLLYPAPSIPWMWLCRRLDQSRDAYVAQESMDKICRKGERMNKEEPTNHVEGQLESRDVKPEENAGIDYMEFVMRLRELNAVAGDLDPEVMGKRVVSLLAEYMDWHQSNGHPTTTLDEIKAALV